jgi:hypothetical protein
VLKDLGDLEGARRLLEKSYATFLAKFGPNHPSTKTVLGNLEGVKAAQKL